MTMPDSKIKATAVTNAIKLSKKRTPGTTEMAVPGGIFLHCFVWDVAQMTAFFLNLTKIGKLSVKLRTVSYLLTNIRAFRYD